MKNTSYKKFALIGLPGSGKSTFASKLGKLLDIPVHHLDRHMFEPGGKKRDKQELILPSRLKTHVYARTSNPVRKVIYLFALHATHPLFLKHKENLK